MLTDFEICDARPFPDDPVIRCRDGKQLVLIVVSEPAWEDAFPAVRHFDIVGHNMLARSNLDALKPPIQRMYDAKQYELRDRYSGIYPHVVITSDVLQTIASDLSGDVLEVRERVHFERIR